MPSRSALAVAAVFAAGISFAASAQTQDELKRPRRIVIHPRSWTVEPPPTAKRYCTSWLEQQARPSGPVIVPRMHCWWQ